MAKKKEVVAEIDYKAMSDEALTEALESAWRAVKEKTAPHAWDEYQKAKDEATARDWRVRCGNREN